MKKLYYTVCLILLVTLPQLVKGQSSSVIQTGCHVNGTMYDGTDDVMTILLNPVAPSPFFEAPYTYTVTATQGGNAVTIVTSNGNPAADIPYGHAVPLKIGDGAPGNGNIELTIIPYGGDSPSVITVTDPGSCAYSTTVCVEGIQTLSYDYRSPSLKADLDEGVSIPQFNAATGQTLLGVDVSVTQKVVLSHAVENSATTASRVRIMESMAAELDLNGNSILTSSVTAPAVVHNLPAGISVPAQNSWGGDIVMGSTAFTLEGMNSWLPGAIYSGLDPRLDPRYVTKASAIPPAENVSYDDDIEFHLFDHQNTSSTLSYTSVNPEMASFEGAGNVPLNYATYSEISSSGGGGNLELKSFAQASFEINTTYTYTQTCRKLPVTIRSFDVDRKEGNLFFEWRVSRESNVDHYDVEVSGNARDFKKLGTVPAKQQERYDLTAPYHVTGQLYFRLKSVDTDGTYAYSKIIDLDIAGQEAVTLYPVPAVDRLYIKKQVDVKIENLVIRDLTGALRKKMIRMPENVDQIGVDDLKPGVYLVETYIKDGGKVVQKIAIR